VQVDNDRARTGLCCLFLLNHSPTSPACTPFPWERLSLWNTLCYSMGEEYRLRDVYACHHSSFASLTCGLVCVSAYQVRGKLSWIRYAQACVLAILAAHSVYIALTIQVCCSCQFCLACAKFFSAFSATFY
jgi:hypothetical protein